MPRAKIRLHSLRLESGFTKKMDEAIQVLIRKAARAWLRAVVVNVPVWSGEARGSIKFARGPYGTLGRYLNVSIPIVPHPTGWRQNKNQDTGGKKGRYNFTNARKQYGFYFRSDVMHYIHHEFYPRTDKGANGQQIVAPWQSLEYGRRAFNRELHDGMNKLPKIQDYIVKHEIPFGV